jgi:hypothetical protein
MFAHTAKWRVLPYLRDASGALGATVRGVNIASVATACLLAECAGKPHAWQLVQTDCM